jgi:hypothetical protein
MFKMQMGLAGVGTPDATYAVACYPADGTKLNLHWDQPWTRSRRRFLTPRQGDKETCYSYTIQKGDTVGGIADHFGLDMRQVSTGFRYVSELQLQYTIYSFGRFRLWAGQHVLSDLHAFVQLLRQPSGHADVVLCLSLLIFIKTVTL